jgi:chemotaxis regulatin CheY-phosphate phosphatase CheZ
VIHLEVCNGSFRIPTEDAIYNITVISPDDSSVAQVVGKIVQQEKGANVPVAAAPWAQTREAEYEDDFYKEISSDLYHDIGKLAKSLNATIMNLPAEDRRGKRAELNEAGEKIEDAKKQLKDIVELTEMATMEIMDQVEKVQDQTNEVKDILATLKEHSAFAALASSDEAGLPEPGEEPRVEMLEKIQAGLVRAREVLGGLAEPGLAADTVAPAAPPEMKTRYLFPLDVVFQTMYELCTNETVKTHITGARKQADTIFAADAFHDHLSEKVAGMVVEDNFFAVPLTDIFRALFVSCADDKVKNLFQRMEKNKDTIFLDQSLPLEMPPTEEVVVGGKLAAVAAPRVEPDPRLNELDGLLADSLALLAELGEQPAVVAASGPFTTMSPEDQVEILNRIEEAFEFSSGICGTVSKITETLSFQDLSGQQILKIIKLLSDFQVQLLGIVVSFGSQLKHKEKDRTLTIEETKQMAQDDVDSYLRSMTTAEVGGEGSLDQGSVNSLLAELGF